MAATESDFSSINTTGNGVYLGDEWPGLVAAIQALTAFFLAKDATGTEPADVLNGIAFGLDGQSTNHLDWRVRATAADEVVIEENTGTDASPVWVARLTIDSTGISGFAVPAHASTHQDGGADEVATATPGANAIVKADADGKIGAGWLDSADIDHGSVGGLTDDDHTQYALADGTRAITGSQQFDVNVKTDTIIEKTAAAGVTVDGCLIKDGVAADADTLDGVQGTSYARLDVSEEFTASKGSTEAVPGISTGGAVTLNFAISNYFELTLTANVTTVNILNTTVPGTYVLKLIQDTTGGRTVSGWPTSVSWPGGTAITVTSGASAVDVITFLVDSAGNIFAVFSQDFS